MAAVPCDHCGGPNAPGAAFCQWCGSPLSFAPSAPSPPWPNSSYRPLEVAGSSGYRPLSAPPVPPRSGPSVGIVVAIVTVLLVLLFVVVAAASFSSLSPPSVPGPGGSFKIHISRIVVTSPDNACGLNGYNSSQSVPFTTTANSLFVLFWSLPGPTGEVPCTVSTVFTNTPGFTVDGAFPFNVTSPGTQFTVLLSTPSSYSGPFNVTFG